METEKSREREQTPEEILRVITEAIERGREVEITQSRADGETVVNLATPISIERNYLTVESFGFGFDMEIDKIKKAEIIG